VGFAEAVATCFRRYATFSGRARRPEYWWFLLFVSLGNLVFGLVDAALLPDAPAATVDVFALATLLPSLAVLWRRLHDAGRTGLWALSTLPGMVVATAGGVMLSEPLLFAGLALAAVGAVVIFVFTVSRTQPGPNAYGDEPPA
jgi:uncharacterized membrane protein YhaH (DUF805 family)